jgi:hypothetical protein
VRGKVILLPNVQIALGVGLSVNFVLGKDIFMEKVISTILGHARNVVVLELWVVAIHVAGQERIKHHVVHVGNWANAQFSSQNCNNIESCATGCRSSPELFS